MEHFPLFIPTFFGFTTLLTIGLYLKAAHQNKIAWILMIAWLCVQGIISLSGFYLVTSMPPRFILLLLPPMLFIVILLITTKGRAFLNGLDIRTLTLLHVVRFPVELVLYSLYLHHTIPAAMTFEGHNWDILSGLTAPLILYAYRRQWLGKWGLLIWNLLCFALLINVVGAALTQGLQYPGFALRYFPYSWLPALIVPLVLLSHLAVIHKLLIRK